MKVEAIGHGQAVKVRWVHWWPERWGMTNHFTASEMRRAWKKRNPYMTAAWVEIEPGVTVRALVRCHPTKDTPSRAAGRAEAFAKLQDILEPLGYALVER